MKNTAKTISAILVFILIATIPVTLSAKAEDKNSQLLTKTMQNDMAAVKKLIESGANINQQNERYGHTPLIIACVYGYEDLARYLIAKGADVNIKGKDGSTALIAAASNSKALVELLISKGADARARMSNGIGVFTQCSNSIIAGRFPLATAQLLIEKGADVNESPTFGAIEGYTPLMTAAKHDRQAFVKLLIKNGADINAKAKDGSTALSLATEKGHKNIVDILKSHGAKEPKEKK